MDKWIIDNIRDCLKYGYSFDWFFNNRKEDYLTIGTEQEFKKEWCNQIQTLSKQF